MHLYPTLTLDQLKHSVKLNLDQPHKTNTPASTSLSRAVSFKVSFPINWVQIQNPLFPILCSTSLQLTQRNASIQPFGKRDARPEKEIPILRAFSHRECTLEISRIPPVLV